MISNFVLQRVFNPSLFESFLAEQATVAGTAGESCLIWIVATVGESVVDAQVQPLFYNLSLGHVDERGVDFHFTRSFHTRFGGQVGERFKRADKFGTAIWITAIIDGVHPDKNMVAFPDFSIGQRIGKKDGVPCRYIGDGDA